MGTPAKHINDTDPRLARIPNSPKSIREKHPPAAQISLPPSPPGPSLRSRFPYPRGNLPEVTGKFKIGVKRKGRQSGKKGEGERRSRSSARWEKEERGGTILLNHPPSKSEI
jgi:hypothetical protein